MRAKANPWHPSWVDYFRDIVPVARLFFRRRSRSNACQSSHLAEGGGGRSYGCRRV